MQPQNINIAQARRLTHSAPLSPPLPAPAGDRIRPQKYLFFFARYFLRPLSNDLQNQLQRVAFFAVRSLPVRFFLSLLLFLALNLITQHRAR